MQRAEEDGGHAAGAARTHGAEEGPAPLSEGATRSEELEATTKPVAFSRVRRVRDARLSLDRVAEGMVTHALRVSPKDVVFVKGVFEASDGVAGVFAISGGDLSLVAPVSREAELIAILGDLEREIA